MGLNYDIACKGIDEAGNNIENAKIHAYFIKKDSGSSDSQWDEDIRLTAGNSKVSFNLGDDSFLTSEGIIKTGDKVLICAWVSDGDADNDDKNSKDNNTITKCVNFIHTIDTSSSSWAEDFTILDVNTPVCDISIPNVEYTGHSFTVTNDSTVNEGSFDDPNYDRDDLYQNIKDEGQDLYLGLEIEKTIYNYQETSQETSGTDDDSYSYVDAGDYTISVRPYNYLGFYCEVTEDEHILYNKPTINFDYTFTKLLNSNKHIGVGNDDELKTSQLSETNYNDTWDKLNATFDWEITDKNQDDSDNTDTYTDKDEDFEPTKYFNTEGDKKITLKINWNDGFDDHTETKELDPSLDVYNITQKITIKTEKEYTVNNTYVPLGDDDKTTLSNLNFDNASQDYDSNTQWKTLDYTITKKKNDGSDDNESYSYKASDDDDYNTTIDFYVKYYHDTDHPWNIVQDLTYWDGYKDVSKSISEDYTSEKYTIDHSFYWSTDRHGKGKNVVDDNDEVSINNTSTFGPQDNQDIVQKDYYSVNKDKYKSYTDDTVEDDTETFEYTEDNLTNVSTFYVKKDGDFTIDNTITFYDGYDTVEDTITRTVTASVLVPNNVFNYSSRNGDNTDIEGRDDTVTFTNSSYLTDYYDKEYSKTSSRNLSIDWFMTNDILKDNFSEINKIGGDTYSDDASNTDEFLDQDMDDKPTVNYLKIDDSQDAKMIFYYNDGYFNRDSSLTKGIKTVAYSDIIPNANYTDTVPDRNTDIVFSDNSTNNENRIIDIDWSLTDRYEDNSMNVDNQGNDNLQTWLNKAQSDEMTTTVNSLENHTLSQDIIRWDNGFSLITFNKDYTINTTNYDINPLFSYSQEFNTGPEIIFKNESTKNDDAVLLTYDYEITDTDNDDEDASVAYRDIDINTTEQKHTYKSVSNSPFEDDKANKEVTIFQDYDDGWNRVYDSYTEDILVKPNRISQDFSLKPIRHENDPETEDNIVTGNNPIEFKDESSTERTDDDFIGHVKYIITESCSDD